MIIDIQRGYIRLQVADGIATVQGEAYLPGYGSPDFVAYKNTLETWDSSFENVQITEGDKTAIRNSLEESMNGRGLTIEIEEDVGGPGACLKRSRSVSL